MEECFTCKEEKDKIQLNSFPCNTCVEGCWYICQNCQDKIIKNFDKCPMCNSSISHLKITLEENEENTNCFKKCTQRYCFIIFLTTLPISSANF